MAALAVHVTEWDGVDKNERELLQKLEEKAQKAQEAFEREEKLRKELEVLNAKLLEEKTALLSNLEGEKGSLSETQERAAKLQAQKNDLDAQLRVSDFNILKLFFSLYQIFSYSFFIIEKFKLI